MRERKGSFIFSCAKEMLYDKAAGFYSVLHESMAGTDGIRFCPTRSEANFMESLLSTSFNYFLCLASFLLVF